MNKKTKIVLIVTISIILLFAIWKIFTNSYNLWEYTDNGEPCINVYEKCTCFGKLTITSSLPYPEYNCKGINLCRDTDEEVCNLI